MGNISFTDKLSARLLTFRQRSPDDLRVTPLRFQLMPFSADEVAAWTELPDEQHVDKTLERPIGMLAVDRCLMRRELQENPTARLGILRAVGRQAVVFAPLPAHHVVDVVNPGAYTPDYQFGMHLGRQTVRVAPVLEWPDKTFQLVRPLDRPYVMNLDAILRGVPVY